MIYNHGHLAVYGSNGMGKSSLLEKITSPQTWLTNSCDPSQAFIIFLNCSEIQLPVSYKQFWEKVLKKLKNQTVANADLTNEIDQVLNQKQLDNDDLVYPQENYSEKQILDLLSKLRNLASYEGHYYSTIVATTKRITNIGPPRISPSPWDNHYAVRDLKPFTEQEITLLLSRLPAIWIEDLQKGALEIAGRHPALLQNACFLLYNTWRDGDIQNVEEFARDFETATRQFFQYAWDECTNLEKSLLKFIALSRLNGRLNQQRQYNLRTGTDSPVSKDSSAVRLVQDRRTASAGTRSPSARIAMSPRTTSRPAMRFFSPSRITEALGLDKSRKASKAPSVF